MTTVGRPSVLLAGIGNDLCADDGLGPQVAARAMDALAPHERAEVLFRPAVRTPSRLLEALVASPRVHSLIVVDAFIQQDSDDQWRLIDEQQLRHVIDPSSHALGLEWCLLMARSLSVLPSRIRIVALPGHEFGVGESCSLVDESAVERVIQEVRQCSKMIDA